MTTTNITNDTANENFITDHGSMRLTCSRARRGPRPAAAATVARALRTASVTRAEPAAAGPVAVPPIGPPPTVTGRVWSVARLVVRTPVAPPVRTLARATAGPLGVPLTETPLTGAALIGATPSIFGGA